MAFVVVYDACVLVPVRLRDLLLRIAESGIVRARWSNEILDEWQRAVAGARPEIPTEKLTRMRELMIQSVPDSLVVNHAGLASEVDLVDPKDLHVVATALRAQAQLIVTFNLRHFPEHALAPYDIEVKHPDEFVLDAIDLFPERISAIVQSMAASLTAPPQSVENILETLERYTLVQSATRLRELLLP